jgi:hypothetical protein
MMTREEAIEFGERSALTALDQTYAHQSLQDAIDSYRENVRTTLQDERADQYEAEAFAEFEKVIANHVAVTKTDPDVTEHDAIPIWSVYVAQRMGPRQRKQTLLIYRVIAETREKAIEMVRTRILHGEFQWRDERIVDCVRSGDSDAVYLAGSVTRTPESVAGMPSL